VTSSSTVLSNFFINIRKFIIKRMLRALIILIALFFSVLTYAQDASPFCYTIDNDSVMFANIKFEVNTDCILPNDFGI
jgi:hypothetical protein